MNFFIVGLTLIFLHGNCVFGVQTEDLGPIDVLATLKTKVPDCDLHTFVKSDKDYQN